MAAAPTSEANRNLEPRAGRWLVAALLPQWALGAWLAAVPDPTAFIANQAAVLLHVLLALLTLPALVVAFGGHLLRWRRLRTARGEKSGVWWPRALLVLLTATVLGTGLDVAYAGTLAPTAAAHRVAGLLLAWPLLWHLLREGRPALLRRLVVTFSVAGVLWLGVIAAARVIGEDARLPRVADVGGARFSGAMAPADHFDSAAWCGGCHAEIFAEWAQSAHGRALAMPTVRREIASEEKADRIDKTMHDLLAGAAAGAEWGSLAAHDLCRQCHAPVGFYAEGLPNLREVSGVAAEAVTCSFCHGVRGRRPSQLRTAALDKDRSPLLRGDVAASLPLMGLYDVGPEGGVRYLGQAAPERWLRGIGDWLIRWRPEVHARTVRSAALGSADFCVGCHGGAGDYEETPFNTWPEWKRSAYAAADPPIRCQDCHMNDAPAQTPEAPGSRPRGAVVPWGPQRAARASHRFLGGNAKMHATLGNADMVERERAYIRTAHRLEIRSARWDGAEVVAEVEVRSPGVGHRYPAHETAIRTSWLEAEVLATDGRLLAVRRHDGQGAIATAKVPLLGRFVDDATLTVLSDSTIPPGGARNFSMRIAVPEGSAPATLKIRMLGTKSEGTVASTEVPIRHAAR